MPATRFFRTQLALLALVALSTAACGGTMGQRNPKIARTTSATFDAPADTGSPSIDELRTREAKGPVRDFRVRAADGVIEMHVKASAPPTVKNKRAPNGSAFSIVTFPIGGDIDATCTANSGALDLAHWVEAILAAIPATLTEPPHVEVEVVEGRPLLLVHTEGIVEVRGVKKRHIAKFATMHLDRGSIGCVHDGVGYDKTFRDVARHIASQSKTPDAERPVFRAISIERDGDRVAGFEELRAYRGAKLGEAKPDESRQMTLSSVVLTSKEGWTTGDGAWVGVVDAKGVVSERSMRRVGKRTVYDMTLTRKSPGLFAYDGTVDGAPKKGSFRSREPLVTRLSRAPALASFVRDGKRKEVAFLHFDENQPAAALREVFTREGGGQLAASEAGTTYHCVVDSDGLCLKMWRDGSTWTLQRVYADGGL